MSAINKRFNTSKVFSILSLTLLAISSIFKLLHLPGTVVMFGGEKEVTEATPGTTAIAGIVSTHPAFLMNRKCSGVAVALRGRVPCKVYGPVSKGDLMVAGAGGVAVADNNANPNAVVGRALENHEDGDGYIEVVVS
jgi:hypothetical protein